MPTTDTNPDYAFAANVRDMHRIVHLDFFCTVHKLLRKTPKQLARLGYSSAQDVVWQEYQKALRVSEHALGLMQSA